MREQGQDGLDETMIRAVLFDADGVLQNRSSDALPTALARLLPDPASATAFITEVFVAETCCFTGLKPFEAELEPILRRWNCGVTVEDALSIWEMVEVDSEVLEIVRTVRSAGLRIGLASNQWSTRARFMSDCFRYDETFHDLFYSCDIGAAKPDVEYFRLVLGRLGVEPGAVLFIDDHELNVRAATAIGIRSERFPRNAGAKEMVEKLLSHGISVG